MSDLPEGMSPENEAAAIAALLGQEPKEPVSVEESVAPPAAVQGSTEEEAPAPEVATPEPADSDESTERTDLAALLEGLSDEAAAQVTRAYRSMLGDYTRKTQELAEERKQFEGIDPRAAREAYEFLSRLQSDGDFAVQVHADLTRALQESGLTPAQAAEEATRQVEAAAPSVDWEDLGIDPSNPLVQTIEGLQKSNAELTAWREQQIRDAQREAVIRDIERQDQALRHSNPDYSDQDFDGIYKIAAALDGDLIQAEAYYRGLKDRILGDYVESKTRTPQGVAPVAPGTPSEPPKVYASTDEAHPDAVERLRMLLANQG